MFMKFLDWANEHLVAVVVTCIFVAFLIGLIAGYSTAIDSAKEIEQACVDFAQQVYECETLEEKDFLLETVYGFKK